VAKSRLPIQHAVYFDVADGRMVFAVPRQRSTYIGTTDTPFEGSPDQVFAQAGDVEYLLAAANAMFPAAGLAKSDVESTWAGLRPLIFEEGKPAGEMSRKDEIFLSESGLVTIAGGKLTGYRKMAEKVVNLVAKNMQKAKNKHFKPCQTKEIPLTSMPFGSFEEVLDFQHFIQEKLKPLNLPAHFPAYLVENYGKDATIIADHAVVIEHGMAGTLAVMKSELLYCLEHEMVVKPADFFERRTGRLYFDHGSIPPFLDMVLAIFQDHFKWNEATKMAEKKAFLSLMQALRNF
jgi:glycerol-3-phosphate dehydrogenase